MMWSIGLVVVLLCHVTASDDWLQQPYGDDSFNMAVEFNANVTLTCISPDPGADKGGDFQYWLLPDLTLLDDTSVTPEVKPSLDGDTGYELETDHNLTLIRVQEDHFGFYHCVRQLPNGKLHAVKKAINYAGPYWGDLWSKYKQATIVASAASGGFLVLALVVAVLMYRSTGDHMVSPPSGEAHTSIQLSTIAATRKNDPAVYDNAGYVAPPADNADVQDVRL